jgi:hypothetical protein
MSNKAKWGYLAALIDGEGYIAISKGATPAPNGNGYMTDAPRYNLTIAVTNTNENLICFCCDTFGGSWSRDKRPDDKPHWKQRCSWRTNGHKNKELILQGVLPYLVAKRRNALLALEFLRLKGQQCPEKREEMYLKMKSFNKRGVSVETSTLDRPKREPVKSMGWRWKQDEIDPILRRMIQSDLCSDA